MRAVSETNRRVRGLLCVGGALLALGLGACGGEDAKVGDCIDDQEKVVDCSSSDATRKLVSDQEKSDAIACIEIGDKPQKQVKVGDGTFCAEPK